MQEKLFLIGGGGFAIELFEYMAADGIEIAGYYAQEDNHELSTYIPWMGDCDIIPYDKFDREASYILAIRLIKFRKKMIEFMEKMDLRAGSFISSKVYCSKLAKIGKGSVIFPNAMITGNPIVGDFLFMDNYSIISHGDILGDNVVLGPGVIITGDSTIGNAVTFGVNSAIMPGTKIGSNVEIAINTYPRKNVEDNSTIISLPGQNYGIGLNKNFN